MTLIEVMVVIAIIALVMGGIGTAAYLQWQKAQLKTARHDALAIATLLEQYRIEHRGNCPRDIVELKGARLANRIRDDPWGSPYSFTCEDLDVTVVSAGPDTEPGTDDDISTAVEPE